MDFPEHSIADATAKAVLDRLRLEDQQQRDAGLSVAERTRNVTATTGLLLYSIVRTKQPKFIMEIGSSTSYSTIWMALAAREYGGSICGSEILPTRAAKANSNIAEAGLTSIAHVEEGDGSEIANRFSVIDLLFLDAEKDDYMAHFERCVDLVASGGLILTDNVVSHDCTSFLTAIRQRNDVVTQTLEFERGLEFTVKL